MKQIGLELLTSYIDKEYDEMEVTTIEFPIGCKLEVREMDNPFDDTKTYHLLGLDEDGYCSCKYQEFREYDSDVEFINDLVINYAHEFVIHHFDSFEECIDWMKEGIKPIKTITKE